MLTKGRRAGGFALISTFLFLSVMFIMALSLILVSRQRVFAGVDRHHRAQALYLAEAGLSRAQVALEADLSWPGVTDATVDGMPGTYTVRFGNDKLGSVNNIGGLAAAESYRGVDTVQPGYALLIVEASVSGQRYVLESLVEGTGSAGYVQDAILASGKVRAKGDLRVDGVAGLSDPSPVDGSIQSNLPGSNDLVVWEGGGTALITGDVGTSGSVGSAINMPGATIMGGPDLNSSAVIPSYDVNTEVTSQATAGLPALPLPSGGEVVLSGDYYDVPSGQINGDLVLEDGATLYINGDLSVNGSIKGEGTVYVNGDVAFKGDSEVTTNDKFSVSLYAEGDIALTGFNGTEFLASISDTQIQEYLAVSEAAVQGIQDAVSAPGASATNAATKNAIWNFSAAMSNHGFQGTVNGNSYANVLYELKNRVSNDAIVPPGPTRDFLEKRVETLEQLFGSAHEMSSQYLGGGMEEALILDQQFAVGGNTLGVVDAVLTDERQDHWPAMVNLVNQVDYNKLGTSYFQGKIYTKGHFYADNEVNVLGAILVDGDQSNPQSLTLPNGDTVTLRAGDIYLGTKTRVTYVEEMFRDDVIAGAGPQLLSQRFWMGR